MNNPLPPWAPGVLEELHRLRARPCPRHVSGGVVVNGQGQLLLVYSSFAAQGWHFPKGGVDEGESAVAGAIKETREEAGVEVGHEPHGRFDLGLGGTFTQSLGFGSPRIQAGEIYNPVCAHFGREVRIQHGAHRGEEMSLGALGLLVEAGRALAVSERDLLAHRYALFDAWRDLEVCWQQQTEYHLLPFVGYRPEWLNGESQRVGWWSLEELRQAAAQEGAELHRHVSRVLAEPGLLEAIESARRQARPGS